LVIQAAPKTKIDHLMSFLRDNHKKK
jgi:hypothetical protein